MAKQAEGNLSKFAQPKPAAAAPRTIAPTKATGETVATTVRFSREDWDRLSEYARKKRVSLQALIEHGCSRILEDDGLKPLKAVVARNRDTTAA
jgi:hypothetical protein